MTVLLYFHNDFGRADTRLGRSVEIRALSTHCLLLIENEDEFNSQQDHDHILAICLADSSGDHVSSCTSSAQCPWR